MSTFTEERTNLREGAKGIRGLKGGRQAFINIVIGELYAEAGYETADQWLRSDKAAWHAVHDLRWTHNAISERQTIVRELYPAGWTQEALADLMGVDQARISHDLKGLNISPKGPGGRPRKGDEDMRSPNPTDWVRQARRILDKAEQAIEEWSGFIVDATPAQAKELLDTKDLIDMMANELRDSYSRLYRVSILPGKNG